MPTEQARRKYRVKVKIITSGALDIATNLWGAPPLTSSMDEQEQ
jgi:hypothetical protein